MEKWKGTECGFDDLQKAVLDTWEDAEAYRKTGREKAEGILERLEYFVDNDQVEV
jgi:hypothetical protein